MPKQKIEERYTTEYVPSIFEDNLVSENRQEVSKQLDNLLKTFQSGTQNSEEGKAAAEYFVDGKAGGVRVGYIVTEQLRQAGICDDLPTVQHMLDAGRKVFIRDENGKLTTFTDKFFNNDTVRGLMEQEAKDEHNLGRGMVMAAFMAAYLSEYNNPDLKNYREIFGENTPEKTPVYLADEKGQVAVIVDKESKTEFDKAIDDAIKSSPAVDREIHQIERDMAEAGKTLESAGNEYNKAVETYEKTMKDFAEKYPEEPKVPDKPREKSGARRFFASIGLARHSKEYNAQKAAYDKAVAEHRKYEEAEAALQKTISEVEDKSGAIMDAQKKLADLNTARAEKMKSMQGPEKARYVMKAMGYIPNMAEYAKNEARKNTINKVFTALGDNSKLQMINDEKQMSIQPGGLETMLSLVNLRGRNNGTMLESEVMAANSFEAMEKTADEVRKMEGSVDDKKKYTVKALAGAYRSEAQRSGILFERVFGMPATPENVQTVMDAVGFDKMVADRLKHTDHVVVNDDNRQIMTLPKVNKRNCSDMTHLLMCGIRTAIREGRVVMGDKGKEYILSAPSAKQGKTTETSYTAMQHRLLGDKPHQETHKHVPSGNSYEKKPAAKGL